MSNRLSRREFFRAILSAMVAGALLSSETVTEAIAQVESDDKIRIVIENARHLLAVANLHRATVGGSVALRSSEEFTSTVHYLYDFFSHNFDPDTTNSEEIDVFLSTSAKTLIDKGESLLDEAELARLTEGLVPIAVTRELLVKHVYIPQDEPVRKFFGSYAKHFFRKSNQ